METYELVINRVLTYRVTVISEDEDTALEQAIDKIRSSNAEEMDDEYVLVNISE